MGWLQDHQLLPTGVESIAMVTRRVGVQHRNITAKQRANLKPPWPKGTSGNPGGRPKSVTLSDAYAKELGSELDDGTTKAEAVARRMVAKAMRGNLAAASEISDRTEGKPTQRNEHSGPDGGAIEIKSFQYGHAVAGIAPRPVGDSEPPGQDQSRGDGPPMGEDADGR